MDTQVIQDAASKTQAGAVSFPEVVGELLRAGVDYYHVDYVARRKTFYAADGAAVVVTPIDVEGLPEVAAELDTAAVKGALRDSQHHGQAWRDFSRRVMAAGVQGYHAFLRGRRVVYLGRQGDHHIDWFPGAQPAARH